MLEGPSAEAGKDAVVAEGAPPDGKEVAVPEGEPKPPQRPWPEECDATMRYAFAGSDDAQASLQGICRRFERLVGEDDCVSNSTLAAASGVDQIVVYMFREVVGLLPSMRVTWLQFLALSAMHLLCTKHYQPSSSESGTAVDCVHLVVHHARQLLADHGSWHSWTDQRLAASIFPRAWLGEIVFAVPSNYTLANAITARQDELWTRFVKRAPQYDDANTTLDEEENFGAAGLRTAESLVAVLLEEPKVDELLLKLGALRRELAEQVGPERGSELMGARRQAYGTPNMGSVTVNSGHYAAAWRRRLFEAVTDESRAADAPLGPFATPNSSDVIWARRCGAVMTWVDVPWHHCAHIINSHHRAGFAVAGITRDWMGDGVSNAGSLCRILMNRAVLRPTLDGILLGEDCKDRFGWAFDNDVGEIWKIFPLTYHASPLAQELVEEIIINELLRTYYQAASDLGGVEGKAERLGLLTKIGDTVASIFYFLSNIQPYIRGSPVAITVLHHALWMRLAAGGEASPGRGRDVLRCMGLWRNGSFPPSDDCHMVRSNGTRFTHYLYSVLLDHPTVRSPEQLAKCVLAAMPVGICQRGPSLEGEEGACLLEGSADVAEEAEGGG